MSSNFVTGHVKPKFPLVCASPSAGSGARQSAAQHEVYQALAAVLRYGVTLLPSPNGELFHPGVSAQHWACPLSKQLCCAYLT